MKIVVDINSVYGRGCMGGTYSSNDEMVMEIEDEDVADILMRELEANDGRLDMYDIENLIDDGEDELEDLHEELWDALVRSEVAFWLERGERHGDSMCSWREKDMEDGYFVPKMSFEEFIASKDVDTEDEDYDEEEWEYEYFDHLQDEYADWVDTLDVYEQADRYGLDVDVVITGIKGEYEISLPSDSE